MTENPHFKELLQTLYENHVEYLIVGGYAVMRYSEPRFTKDLDLWVNNSPQNADRVYRALAEFGAPLTSDGLGAADFGNENLTYQIGVAPLRIDILTHIDGIAFAEAWPNREESTLFSIPVCFISREDLIKNKRAAGRAGDIEHLRDLSG